MLNLYYKSITKSAKKCFKRWYYHVYSIFHLTDIYSERKKIFSFKIKRKELKTMIKRFEKEILGESLHNGVYTAEIFDYKANKRHQIIIELSEKTEADIFKMIKISSSVNEWSPEYDFLKEVIQKYSI